MDLQNTHLYIVCQVLKFSRVSEIRCRYIFKLNFTQRNGRISNFMYVCIPPLLYRHTAQQPRGYAHHNLGFLQVLFATCSAPRHLMTFITTKTSSTVRLDCLITHVLRPFSCNITYFNNVLPASLFEHRKLAI